MTIAYQHRPLSKIIAQPNGAEDEASTGEKPPRDEHGRFTKAAEEPQDTPDLPEKYRNKSVEQVVEMHQNSERRLGQLQNEVGQLRGLVQDLAQVQRVTAPAKEEQQDVDLSGDELLTDPVSAIKKVVQATQPAQQERKQNDVVDDVNLKVETGALFSDFPDMDAIIASEEFQTYANKTQYRQRDVQIAADPNAGIQAVEAARRLLEGFNDYKESAQSEPKKDDPVARARAVANEPGHERAVVPKDVIYETDVIALISSDPEKYRSPSFQRELTAAIREGRFVKQT
jgi:hypothetical protein